ncbi:MAG: UDP-glucose 4-epimerase GalE [Oscillospiraceae bacterium]|nr:UDP-glucose 4-epimerase GalE [Oscillospiraceae bacterium]
MNVLVTGGAGFIGSHTVIELIENGYDVLVVDNFSNSKPEALNRIEKITGKRPKFYDADLLDIDALGNIFAENKIDAVIHFAGYKAVGESTQKPLMYYENNLVSTINLCKVMNKYGCKKLVFSSSATVYGSADKMPVCEDYPHLSATNPYGMTKLMIENILADIVKANPDMSVVLLRYFNPIGAHESGLIGEDPNGIPNNLMPYITQVSVGKLPHLNIFGNDYDTHDGTGVRDYIHVVDLAHGHLKALEKSDKDTGLFIYNLGTGKGYSVLDIVKAFEKASGKPIPYKIVERRAGDVAMLYADVTKARDELGFVAQKTLDDMCHDSYNWQKNNPNGLN